MRKRKLMWILVSILAVIGIAVGGFIMHQHQEKQKMIRIANSDEAKKIYEAHMKALDKNALTTNGIIKSYEINNDNLYYNPMGGMEVTVFVNGDKDLDFQFGIIEDENGKLVSGAYTISSKLSKRLKEQ